MQEWKYRHGNTGVENGVQDVCIVVVVVISGMQDCVTPDIDSNLHSPQRAILSHVDCFRECEIVTSQIVMDGACPCLSM